MFLERPETVYFRKLGKHSSAPTWQTDRSTLGNVRVACKHTHMHVLTCAASGSGKDHKWAFSIYSSAWGNSSSMATTGLTFIMQAPYIVLWLWWASSLITGCVTSSSTLLTHMATEEPQRPVVNSPSQITLSIDGKLSGAALLLRPSSITPEGERPPDTQRWPNCMLPQAGWPASGQLPGTGVHALDWPNSSSCNMTEHPIRPIPSIFSSPPKLARTASSNKHQQSTAQIHDALTIARQQWKVACCHPHHKVCCLAMHGVSFSHTHQLPFDWERCG